MRSPRQIQRLVEVHQPHMELCAAAALAGPWGRTDVNLRTQNLPAPDPRVSDCAIEHKTQAGTGFRRVVA